jgi:hypothetical protein
VGQKRFDTPWHLCYTRATMASKVYRTQAIRSLSLAAALALLLLLMAGLAATAAPPSADVRLLASGPEGLTLEVVVPEPVEAGGSDPATLLLDGYLPGPDGLPVRDLLLGLPPTGDVQLSIEPLAPARVVRGPTPTIPAPRFADEEEGFVAQANWTWQPLPNQPRALPLASLVDEGFLRGWRVAHLQLAPMAYLGDGRWQWTSRFRVRLTFDGAGGGTEAAGLDPLRGVVQGALVNGEQAMAWRSDDPPLRPTTVYTLPAITWRVGITTDGLYRLSYEALDAAGALASGPGPQDIHLLWRGQEVALQEVGTGDGSLDPGDAFLFYGQKLHGTVQDEKYTDENVYWLAVDASTPGRRMAARSVAPGGLATPATWYTETVRAEQDNVYWARWSDHPGTEATWFWEQVIAVTPLTRTYPLALNALAPDPYTATLRLELAALSEYAAYPDHHLRLSLNGTPVGEDLWDGKVGRVITLPFASTLLQAGSNDVGVAFLPDAGIQKIYFDWAGITFRRQTIAQDDQLSLSAPFEGNAAYTLTGFTTDALHLYDLSDPLNPIELTDANPLPDGPTWKLEFVDHGTAAQPYLAVAEAGIQDVPGLVRYEPPLDLLSAARGADEIMIVPGEFYTAVQPLANHRRAEGLRVEVVRVEDLYALFNGGVFQPQAIRDFVAYAYEHWQPPAVSYVLLVGDGHFNFKGHNPATYGDLTPIYIPPYLDFIDPYQGEVAVDSRFGQIVGDDAFPDVAVGRLPANSAQEVEEVVDKIINYETDAAPDSWDRLIFAADNVPDEGGDFEGVLNDLASDFVPAWMQQERVYLTDYCGPPVNPPAPCPSATLALTETWSQGAAMVTFMGHGSVHRWTHEPLLLNTQIDSLRPGHGLPFVMTLNCLDGYWMMPPKYPGLPNTRSMAEWLVMAADHGSIANFSPAGLGTTGDEEVIARAMYGAMFHQEERRLGELALVGQWTPVGYLAQISTLFGDPAGRLQMPASAIYLPLVVRQ